MLVVTLRSSVSRCDDFFSSLLTSRMGGPLAVWKRNTTRRFFHLLPNMASAVSWWRRRGKVGRAKGWGQALCRQFQRPHGASAALALRLSLAGEAAAEEAVLAGRPRVLPLMATLSRLEVLRQLSEDMKSGFVLKRRPSCSSLMRAA